MTRPGTGWTQQDLRDKGLTVVGDADVRPFRAILGARATEHEHQVTLFEWSRHPHTLARYPQVSMLYSIPNGGHRHASTAAKMQREGQRPGMPDVCLPVAAFISNALIYERIRYAALYLELKVRENDVTDEQDAVMRELHAHGNAVTTAWGWQQAAAEIIDYLTEPEHFISGV